MLPVAFLTTNLIVYLLNCFDETGPVVDIHPDKHGRNNRKVYNQNHAYSTFAT